MKIENLCIHCMKVIFLILLIAVVMYLTRNQTIDININFQVGVYHPFCYLFIIS